MGELLLGELRVGELSIRPVVFRRAVFSRAVAVRGGVLPTFLGCTKVKNCLGSVIYSEKVFRFLHVLVSETMLLSANIIV